MKRMKLWMIPLAAALFAACSSSDSDDPAPQPNPTPTPNPNPSVESSYTALPTGAGAYRDACLTLEFKSAAPSLGTSGKIRIYTAAGKQVDEIDLKDVAAERTQLVNTSLYTTAMDAIGSRKLGAYRIVNYDPVRIEGRRVTIKPHYAVLDYNASYYVTVDKEAIVAEAFDGIAASEWTFTTKAAPSGTSVTVGERGADFRTVQAALDYAYDCGRDAAVTVTVKNGIYEEQLFMRYNNNVTLRGESRTGTVIRYDNCEALATGVGSSVSSLPALGQPIQKSGGRGVMLVENCDLLRIENLTLENTHGSGSQAEALYFNDNTGTGRLVFVGCDILSAQDTFNLKGYCWFCDCLVAGDVDFIWGGVDTALFEKCEIRSVNGGYIVQARCAAGKRGFVFIDCSLTKAAGANSKEVYLARTGGTATSDNVTYVNCRMGTHVAAAGWLAPMSPAAADAVNGWKEYGSTDAAGASLDLSKRLAGSYRLTQAEYEAGFRDRATVFAACSKGTEWLRE
ncbi:pectinesterase family protein [Alistipes sp.]|uniref:pectinesterase family protein n=1 Tax=Alistipes sp. TaxID=1872444 RepID=UPI003AF00796